MRTYELDLSASVDAETPDGPEELVLHAVADVAPRCGGTRDSADDYAQVLGVAVVRVTDSDGRDVTLDEARRRVSPSDWQATLDRLERQAIYRASSGERPAQEVDYA